MYKVLVTNDDGINADGIRTLTEALVEFAEVYVVAPARQQSAKGQSITFLREMTVEEVKIRGVKKAYAVEGTPTDCVKWAIYKLAEEGVEFDYVISGINMGGNCGAAAYYSGTISAAVEGSLNGIRSIALSVQSHKASHFEYLCGMLSQLMELSKEIPVSTVLSVNAPDIPGWKVKGVKMVSPAPYGYGETYAFDVLGDETYRMRVDRDEPDLQILNDYNAVTSGYVAISPISFSLNDPASLMKLQGLASTDDTIVIFVDAQDRKLKSMEGEATLRENMIALAKCVNRLDIPAIVVEGYGWGHTLDGITNNLDRSEIVVKDVFNIWSSSDFDRIMSVSNSRKIIMAGTETHTSILQTAEEAVRRGYEVTIIEDCCASTSPHEHRMAADVLRSGGCRVSTLESEMLKLTEASNRPAMKSIRKILGINPNLTIGDK